MKSTLFKYYGGSRLIFIVEAILDFIIIIKIYERSSEIVSKNFLLSIFDLLRITRKKNNKTLFMIEGNYMSMASDVPRIKAVRNRLRVEKDIKFEKLSEDTK